MVQPSWICDTILRTFCCYCLLSFHNTWNFFSIFFRSEMLNYRSSFFFFEMFCCYVCYSSRRWYILFTHLPPPHIIITLQNDLGTICGKPDTSGATFDTRKRRIVGSSHNNNNYQVYQRFRLNLVKSSVFGSSFWLLLKWATFLVAICFISQKSSQKISL